MSIMSQTVTFILAGGRDDRLSPITSGKPRTLLPFGGVLCILDFAVSNCLNSDIERAYLLTQYKPGFIRQYIESSSWKTDLVCLPPRFANAHRGTADMLYQNLDLIRSRGTEYVLVLEADHLCKINYSRLVRFHVNEGADATIAAVPYPRHSVGEAELLEIDSAGQITGLEKPNQLGQQSASSNVLASMGVYVFKASALHKALLRDAGMSGSNYDFRKDVLPKLVRSDRVLAYDFASSESGKGGYWRSLGTIDAYHRAQMESLALNSAFDPYQDARWPLYAGGKPVASYVMTDPRRMVLDSIISEDAQATGAAIIQSVISKSVEIGAGVHIAGSVVMPGARVGRGAKIRRAIVCEGAVIPEGERIGFDTAEDRHRFFVTENGVAVVHSSYARRLQGDPAYLEIAKSA
jgi:glucose-1-phosphate adenylyltransferase